MLAEYARELGRIGVTFDKWFSEQSLYDDGLVERARSRHSTKAEISPGVTAQYGFWPATILRTIKTRSSIRSNGRPTYFASDIAYHYEKFLVRNFDRVVDVWAVDHQGHVPRMNAMMQAFGLDPERLIILMYDLVKLVRDGAGSEAEQTCR